MRFFKCAKNLFSTLQGEGAEGGGDKKGEAESKGESDKGGYGRI